MKIVFLSCVMGVESDFHENNPEISEVTQTYGKYIYVPTVTAAAYVLEELAKCYMLYKDPLLETYKVYYEVSSKFIIQSNEFRQLGRSGICINFNAMDQMWIDIG